MNYKINIHAHSIFSDGLNSPYTMAIEAKRLGFTSLVITDHFYGRSVPEFISKSTMHVLRKACREARNILPVIIGLEVPFMEQEVLIFGGAAIRDIVENGKPTRERLLKLKEQTGCAVVLCHPGEDFDVTADVVDGFEHFNSGRDFFGGGERSFGLLSDKQKWCNSDAHRAEDLGRAYNIVDSKIEDEVDLIKYIKRGRQPKFYC